MGVYDYRSEVLAAYSVLLKPMIEQAEKLEQMRLFSAEFRIRDVEVDATGKGVNTPECL